MPLGLFSEVPSSKIYLYEIALSAVLVKLTFPEPSPLGFAVVLPTISAVTFRLVGAPKDQKSDCHLDN
jgi:hypothetical protein